MTNAKGSPSLRMAEDHRIDFFGIGARHSFVIRHSVSVIQRYGP
jgi:hypothetical protein